MAITKFSISTIAELKKVADFISNLINSHYVFLFKGEIGSGKTTLIKEIVKTMGVMQSSSPSYSIINTYLTQKKQMIYHVDCFRINNINEAYDIGLLEIIDEERTCFIEWPEKILNLLPANCVNINIEIENNIRKISITT